MEFQDRSPFTAILQFLEPDAKATRWVSDPRGGGGGGAAQKKVPLFSQSTATNGPFLHPSPLPSCLRHNVLKSNSAGST